MEGFKTILWLFGGGMVLWGLFALFALKNELDHEESKSQWWVWFSELWVIVFAYHLISGICLGIVDCFSNWKSERVAPTLTLFGGLVAIGAGFLLP